MRRSLRDGEGGQREGLSLIEVQQNIEIARGLSKYVSIHPTSSITRTHQLS